MTPDGVEAWAAACLLPSFDGPEAPAWALRWVEAGVGGFVLFATNVRDPGQVAALSARLRALRDDTLVAVDEEGGDVTRLFSRSGSPYPGPLALGFLDDVELTRRIGQAIGAELRAAGVNLNLAPVADVNSNPQNPVIGMRAFGADPARVAAHVAAFVEGQQAAGVAACAKHFPGHGDTSLDSHLALPTTDIDAAGLEAGPLLPFRAAIAAGVRSIMSAHIRVPALDDAPATLSRTILHGILREQLGFEGTVITDALDMGAISRGVGIERGAVVSLAAGADALCLGPQVGEAGVEAVRRAIVDAVRGGELAEERLREAAGRVRSTAVLPVAGGAPDRSLGRSVAASAVTVEGRLPALAGPLDVLLAEPDPNIAAGPPAFTLGDALAALRSDVRVHRVGPRSSFALGGRLLVLVLRDAGRHPWQQELAGSLRPDVVVEVGLPGFRPPSPMPLVVTHGAGRASLEAAASLLVRAGA